MTDESIGQENIPQEPSEEKNVFQHNELGTNTPVVEDTSGSSNVSTTSGTVASHPSGWYPSPGETGMLRYFDGFIWTEHRSPATPQEINNPKTFGGAIRVCLNKYATFAGRASRSEFWWFVLFAWLVNMVTSFIPIVGSLASLALAVPMLAVGSRRLHDTDRSAWWLTLPLLSWALSLFALVTFIVVIFSDSEFSSNFSTQFFSPSLGLSLLSLVVSGLLGIIFLVLTVTAGTPGPNRYGDPA